MLNNVHSGKHDYENSILETNKWNQTKIGCIIIIIIIYYVLTQLF